MNIEKRMTWKQAFMSSPGPDNVKEAAVLTLKGLCMGSADIIPGVSGGTIALITGIYHDLLKAIRSANTNMLKKLALLDFKGAMSMLHIRFLFFLFIGIGTAILSLARLMNYLIHHQPVYTWSFFFGLIAASIFVVGNKVKNWFSGMPILSFCVGTITAYVIVGQIPVSTPETIWFIFISGFIAICAMILPGLSGAYILLILGKYEFITGTLKNPFIPLNILIIIVFCIGCLCGLLLFSRILNYLLDRWHNITLAFLTGLMAGAMKKIWPWKEPIDSIIIRGKEHVLTTRNIIPDEFNSEVFIALILVITGFIMVLIIEWLSREKKEYN